MFRGREREQRENARMAILSSEAEACLHHEEMFRRNEEERKEEIRAEIMALLLLAGEVRQKDIRHRIGRPNEASWLIDGVIRVMVSEGAAATRLSKKRNLMVSFRKIIY